MGILIGLSFENLDEYKLDNSRYVWGHNFTILKHNVFKNGARKNNIIFVKHHHLCQYCLSLATLTINYKSVVYLTLTTHDN